MKCGITRQGWTSYQYPFNLTGHPAISIPCGTANGLPIGMMLIGRHWQEATIYRAAHAYEQGVTIPQASGKKKRR